jgi:hypothetical protein
MFFQLVMPGLVPLLYLLAFDEPNYGEPRPKRQ